MGEGPGQHIAVLPAERPDTLAAEASRDRVVVLLLVVPVVAAFSGVVYWQVRSITSTLIVTGAFFAAMPVAAFFRNRSRRVRSATQGLWSKLYRTIWVETDGRKRTYGRAYLVMTTSGVAIREQRTTRLGSVTYEQVCDVPWSNITDVEYVNGRRGWRNPVLKGPGTKIAAPGSVDQSFEDALRALGASVR